MSTKSSLEYVEWQETKEIHIYKDTIDDKYYIETEQGRLKLPERYARAMALALAAAKTNLERRYDMGVPIHKYGSYTTA